MKSIWTPTLAWLAAVSAALVFAIAGPNESNVMGRLPTLTVKRLDQQRIVLPRGLTADRTLALVAYSKAQREEIESWIQGLRLDQDSEHRLDQDAGVQRSRATSDARRRRRNASC